MTIELALSQLIAKFTVYNDYIADSWYLIAEFIMYHGFKAGKSAAPEHYWTLLNSVCTFIKDLTTNPLASLLIEDRIVDERY